MVAVFHNTTLVYTILANFTKPFYGFKVIALGFYLGLFIDTLILVSQLCSGFPMQL